MMNSPDTHLKISPIPAFNDNYIWAIENAGGDTVLVDPGDAAPVEAFLANGRRTLRAILITHHHADHTGGIDQLCRKHDIPVFGPAGGHIKGVTNSVKDEDVFTLLGAQIKVMAVPGHTLDHLAYLLLETTLDSCTSVPALFCGDTLFAGGCGRLFEGSPEMMYTSLLRIGALPAQTRIYCAHEYTLSNLGFAAKAEPDNEAIELRRVLESQKRAQAIPTLPSTIFEELRTNPFLRCHSDCLKEQVSIHMAQELHSDLETFVYLRRWKDKA